MRNLWLVLLVACGDPNDGTAVGNPGKLSMQVMDLPSGTELEAAAFDVAALELVGHRVTILRFDDPFDLVSPDDVEFPGGVWDHVVVLPRGDKPLMLSGVDAEGEAFERVLAVEPMIFEGSFTVDGDDVIVGLRLASGTLATAESEPPPVPVDSGIDEDGVRGAIGVGDGIYLDANLDGRSSDSELASEAQAVPKSCRTGSGTLALLWTPLLLLFSRRR